MIKDYVKALEDCNIILKIIFALPVLDGIVYGLYRIFKGIIQKNVLLIVLGCIWIFAGMVITWVIDIISIFVKGKVAILA